MRAERRRRGRAIRRASARGELVIFIRPSMQEFQQQLNRVLARMDLALRFGVVPTVFTSLAQLNTGRAEVRRPRQLLHNGRAPKGRG